MLYLNEEEVFQAVELKEIIEAIEKSMRLYESEDFEMPTRMHMDYDGNTLLLMPSSAEKKVGAKLLTITPANREKDISMIQGCYILSDGVTGEMLSIINASSLTALRTGAIGAVSLKHMTSRDIDSVGVIGAGVQGYHQALYALEVRNLENLWVYDIDEDQLDEFSRKLNQQNVDTEIHKARSSTELVKNSGVVITTTTSTEPVVPDEPGLIKGKHFIGIGSYRPEMRELPRAVFKEVEKVMIDTEDALEETGDLITPLEKGWIKENQIYTIGKLLEGNVDVDFSGTTLFKSVGMALFDLVAVDLVYEEAEKKGLGTELQ